MLIIKSNEELLDLVHKRKSLYIYGAGKEIIFWGNNEYKEYYECVKQQLYGFLVLEQ